MPQTRLGIPYAGKCDFPMISRRLDGRKVYNPSQDSGAMRSYRQWYEKKTSALGNLLGSLGLTPNFLTLLTLIPALLTCYLFWSGSLVWGCVFIVATSFFDVFDGSTARATGKVTKFGQVLDHTVDRIVDFLFSLGIAAGGFANWAFAMTGYFLMFLASYVRAKSESLGDLDCDVGLMDRKSKVMLMFAGVVGTLVWSQAANAAFILLGITSLITVVQRIRHSHEVL